MPKNALHKLFLPGSWILNLYLVNILQATLIYILDMKMCVCVSMCVLINYISINEMINHDQAMYILYVSFVNHYISTIFKLYTKMVVYFEALISLFAIVFFQRQIKCY